MLVTFNGVDLGDESRYSVQSIDGLDSLPDLTIGTTPRPRRNGSWLGGKLSQKRVITIQVDVLGDPDDEYRTTRPFLALQRACEVADYELPLNFDLGFGEPPIMVYASVTAFDAPRGINYALGRSVTVEFTCTDPNKYAGVAQIKSTPPPVRPAATPYGAAYGFAHSMGTGLSGAFLATNAGNSNSQVVYTITGPVTRPAITLTDGQGTRRTDFNLTLAASDRLVIDTAVNRLELNGADRFGSSSGALITDLFFRPGDTTVAFTAEAVPDENPGSLSAEWRDASR